MASQAEIRERITNRIIQALRSGQLPPWRRPWCSDPSNTGFPANAISKKSYRGINVLLLQCQSYQSRWWATYRQWREIGGQVRRGEHGTRIVFWKPIERTVINSQGQEETQEFLLLREYTVFNAEQCDGAAVQKFLVQPGTGGTSKFIDFAPAEEVVQATKADIRYGGNKAAYCPDDDYIQLPPKPSFLAEHDFYATAFHELAHWTGHPSRLDRLNKNARFGSAAYSLEELVAEIAGCYACTEVGIPQSDDLTNHASYVKHWLRVLQQDHGAILLAAGQASRAVDYVLAFSRAIQGEDSREPVESLAG